MGDEMRRTRATYNLTTCNLSNFHLARASNVFISMLLFFGFSALMQATVFNNKEISVLIFYINH